MSGERWISIILLAASGYLYKITYDFRNTGIDFLGTAFFPRLILLLLIVLAVILFFYKPRIQAQDDDKADKKNQNTDFNANRALVILISFFIYIIAIPVIGFFVSTPLFLFFAILYIKGRTEKQISTVVTAVFLALGTTFLVYIIFTRVVYIMFP